MTEGAMPTHHTPIHEEAPGGAPARAVSWRRDLVWLVGAALLLRILYFAQYAAALPFVDGPIADSVVYLEQAYRIRHGELGAAVLLAFSPLYGYFLFLSGSASSLVMPLLLQFLLGTATAAALYMITLRLAGRRAARFTAMLALGYGTLLYYESKILSESLSLALAAFALQLYLSDGTRAGRFLQSVGSGVLFGLSVLARASLVFASPLVVLAALVPWQLPRESWRVCARRALGVAAGLAVVFGGNGLLNLSTTGLFVPVILVSRTVEASSASAFDGNLSSVQFGEGAASSYDVVNSAKQRLADEAAGVTQASSSAARIDVVGWLRNAPSKLLKSLSAREITFQYGFNAERDHVGVLRLLPVGFGLILLWGLVGAVAWSVDRGPRALVPLLPLVLGVLITTTLYHPSTRYRLAMVLPLLVLAGIGFSATLRTVGKRGRALITILGVASAGLVGAHLASTGYNRAEFELQLAMSCGIQGDLEGQAVHAIQATRHAPTDESVHQRAQALIQGARGAGSSP